MKGLILAGGRGSRLYPATLAAPKPLIPVYNKPMIYYPLASLLHAGVTDIAIITSPKDISLYVNLFGDGSALGIKLSYLTQPVPQGIAQCFIIAENFIGTDNVALALGDNIFYGDIMKDQLAPMGLHSKGAKVFAYEVKNPEKYGVIEFDAKGKVLTIEEKPSKPKSNYIVPGLYFYDNDVVKIAKNLKPSQRGELEITDVNKVYLNNGSMFVDILDNSIGWFDTGNQDDLLTAANAISAFQKSAKREVACIEEICFDKGLISKQSLERLANEHIETPYGKYLQIKASSIK